MNRPLCRAALAAALACALLAPAARADEMETGLALATANACMACHQVDAHRVGPPLREVAARYAGAGEDSATIAYLAATIRQGGRGRWGAIPMPAQPQVDAEEARRLAEWILSLDASP